MSEANVELILYRLQQLDAKVGEMDKKIDELKTDVTVLKTKSIIYGGAAGFLIALIIEMVIQMIKI